MQLQNGLISHRQVLIKCTCDVLKHYIMSSVYGLTDFRSFNADKIKTGLNCSCLLWFCSCCSFCTQEVSGFQFSQLFIVRRRLVHSRSVPAPVPDPDPAQYLTLSSLFTAKNKYAGGNSVCPRPTPTWQKGIGDFFGGPPRKPEKENQRPQEAEDDEEAGGSGMSKASRKYVF